MKELLEDYLLRTGVDSDALMQAACYYVGESTDDLTGEEMHRLLDAASGKAEAIQSSLESLQRDTDSLEKASLAVLAWAWDDPREREQAERALEAAKTKLPVIETATLAIVAMYGMYLIATGGRKRTRSVEKFPDGTEREVLEEYYPHALSSLAELFRRSNDGAGVNQQ